MNHHRIIAIAAILCLAWLAARSEAQTLSVNGVAGPSPVSVVAGATISVGVADGPGDSADWIGLYPSTAADGGYLDWRYLNGTTVAPQSGLTTAALSFAAPVEPGQYEFRMFSSNGFTRLAVSGEVTIVASPASISVNGVNPPDNVPVVAGSYVSVGVSNGPANTGDWVGLFATNAQNGQYLAWRYLNSSTSLPGSGLANATLNFAVPVSAGSYEFRLFSANGFLRLSTSTAMVVSTSLASVAVNGISYPHSTSAIAGAVVTVSVAEGPSNAGDWVGLFPEGASDGAFVDWRYLNDTAVLPQSGNATGTLHFLMPATGRFEFRLLADNGSARLATSGPVLVSPSPAQVDVDGVLSPSSFPTEPGATITVHVSGGPGNPTDWIALADKTSPDGVYLSWQYLNGSTTAPAQGLTTGTVAFVMPPAAGQYELRLFANNGFSRIATSTTVVSSSNPPVVSISLTEPFPGTTFAGPSSLSLNAVATVENGTIVRTDFFAGATLIGSDVSSPYSATWSSPAPGTYVLTAVATDSLGATTTSTPVSTTVVDAAGGGGLSGVLGPPLFTPPSGIYAPNQQVTMSAAAGATIRYTVNGDEPTQASSVYSGPAVLLANTVLKARAYQPGWQESQATAAAYQIDGDPPVLSATLVPRSNAAGWNNGPVTVTFTCTDVSAVVCPDPVTVSNDTSGQVVSGQAIDAAGNTSSINVTVRVDRTPALLTISGTSGVLTTTSASTTITAQASDALSGVSRVTCNNTLAAPNGGSFDCNVPLVPGYNTVVVHALDAAGNSQSVLRRVLRTGTPTHLAVIPSQVTLVSGEERQLTAVGSFGTLATGISWTSGDESIAVVSPEGIVTGVSPGQTTMTCSFQGLTAETTVTVQSVFLSSGALKWVVPASPELGAGVTVFANRVAADGADVFYGQYDTTSGTSTVRALTAEGAQLWSETVPAKLLFADFDGGFVGVVPSEIFGEGYGSALLRSGGTNEDYVPWEYQSDPSMGIAPGVAATADGTIYLIETPASGEGPAVVVGLDQSTGGVKFRTPLPESHSAHNFPLQGGLFCGSEGVHEMDIPSISGQPAVGGDGALYVGVLETDFSLLAVCTVNGGIFSMQAGQGYVSYHRVLRLTRIDENGSVSSVKLSEWQDAGPDTPVRLAGGLLDYPGSVAPDGQGGLLANWQRRTAGLTIEPYSQFTDVEDHVSRVVGPVAQDHLLRTRHFDGAAPFGEPSPVTLTGDAALAYVKLDATLSAVNVQTWSTQWSAETASEPVMALPEGGVATRDPDTGTLEVRAADGSVIAASPMALSTPRSPLAYGDWYSTLDDAASTLLGQPVGSLVAIAGPSLDDASFSFNASAFGNYAQQLGIQLNCKNPKFEKFNKGWAPGSVIKWMITDKPGWTADQIAGVIQAITLWRQSDTATTNNLSFEETQTESEATLTFYKGTTGSKEWAVGSRLSALPSPGATVHDYVKVSNDTLKLLSQTGYHKMALHEIGHSLGLKDTFGYKRSSVMNQFSIDRSRPFPSRDDPSDNIALTPTACDQIQAAKSSQR